MAGQRFRDRRIALAIFRAQLAIARQVATAEPAANADIGALEQPRFLGIGRRQVEAQHFAAGIEISAIQQQQAIAVVDARAGVGRRDQAAQQRRDTLGIDRKFKAKDGVVRRAVAFTRTQFQQAIRVDGDGIGFRRRGSCDRARDDFALHDEALYARVDQAGAKLRQEQNADNEGGEAGDIDEDDAARQAGETERDDRLPRLASGAADAFRAQHMPRVGEIFPGLVQ